MLQRSLSIIIHAVRSVFVVLKVCDAAELPLLLGKYADDSRVRPLLMEHPERGIGSNLASAVAQLPIDTDVAVVMLADMPFIKSATVQTLVAAGSAQRLVAPVIDVDGRVQRGHPVLFGRDFFEELRALRGDQGAREILQRHPEKYVPVAVEDSGVIRDIDCLSMLDFASQSIKD